MIHATGLLRANSSVLPLLLVGGNSVSVTASCDDNVGEVDEDEVEELVNRPGTTNGTYFVFVHKPGTTNGT